MQMNAAAAPPPAAMVVMEKDESTTSMPDPNQLRLAANRLFAANALDEALPLYTLAVEGARQRRIEQPPPPTQNEVATAEEEDELVLHLCNLSACQYKMELYDEACQSADEAVNISHGRNLKAFFRLARAQLATKEYVATMDTVQRAISRCDEEIMQQHQQQQQLQQKHDDQVVASDNINNVETNNNNNVHSIILQRKEFEKLKAVTLREQQTSSSSSQKNDINNNTIHSIKFESRTPSIKEFSRPNKSSDSYTPLGNGNFSTVVICQHKGTNEVFALKIIEKEECKKLAKRQHPNVYNEVAMERRILTQKRLPNHMNIIHCYHAMQGMSTHIYDWMRRHPYLLICHLHVLYSNHTHTRLWQPLLPHGSTSRTRGFMEQTPISTMYGGMSFEFDSYLCL